MTEQAAELFAFTLPDWIPSETWEAFLEMRKKIRKPATEKAKELLVMALDRLRQQGYDPQVVLEQSIRNDWQDVYAPKSWQAQVPRPHVQLSNIRVKPAYFDFLEAKRSNQFSGTWKEWQVR